MKNNDVLDMFLRGREAKNSSKNLISYGSTLFNYNTKIAQNYGAITFINGNKYSSTTSKHQNYLKSFGISICVPKDIFEAVTSMDYSEAYDLVWKLRELKEENQIDFTSTLKRDAKSVEEAYALVYINKK